MEDKLSQRLYKLAHANQAMYEELLELSQLAYELECELVDKFESEIENACEKPAPLQESMI